MEWLASKLNGNEKILSEIFDDKFALKFLMTWSFFEKECFDGFMKMEKITKCYISKLKDSKIVNECFKYFHSRYQDNDCYRNLNHGNKSYEKIDDILKCKKEDVIEKDRLIFLLYVVYRYRNNIFHGNKGLLSWLKYKEQIEKCIDIMKYCCDKKLRI